ncbi:MAG: hypothetical protein ACM3JD_03300 [Rudaea sp.]
MIPGAMTLSLPADLCERVQARYLGDRFATLDEFVRYVLEELMRDDAIAFDRQEEEIVEQRLRDLGYL